MHHSHHGAFLLPPLRQQRQQGLGGAGIHRIEGLVEQDQLALLHQQPRQQHALQLAGRQGTQWPLFKPLQLDPTQGLRHARPLRQINPAPSPAGRPATQQHAVLHRHRKAAVDVALLWQVGNALSWQIHPQLPARQRHQPEHAFEQGALARAVRAHHGGQRAGGDVAAHVVQRRVLPVADRHIVQSHHGVIGALAHNTRAHSRPMAGSVASMRSQAGQASGLLCWRHRRKNWVAIESSIDKTVSAGWLNSRHNAT